MLEYVETLSSDSSEFMMHYGTMEIFDVYRTKQNLTGIVAGKTLDTWLTWLFAWDIMGQWDFNAGGSL